MLCTDKCAVLDLLTSPERSRLNELRKTLPRRRNNETTPQLHMPRWSSLPLSKKIPMMPTGLQPGEILSREKLGKKLRFNLPDRFAKFDLSTRLEPIMSYDALHDRHLATFFKGSCERQKILYKAGLISPEFDVLCSQNELNAYRDYLFSNECKLLKDKIENDEALVSEKLKLALPSELDAKRAKRVYKEGIVAQNRMKIKSRINEWIQVTREKVQLDDEREGKVYDEKVKKLQMKMIRSKLKREYHKQRFATMAEEERQKLLRLKRISCEKDRRYEKNLMKLEEKKINEKIKKETDRFEQKKACQEQVIERKKLLEDCEKNKKQAFIQSYEKKIDNSRKKFTATLNEVKKKLASRKRKMRSKRKRSDSVNSYS